MWSPQGADAEEGWPCAPQPCGLFLLHLRPCRFPILDATQPPLALLCPQPRERPALEHGIHFKKFLHPDPSPGMAFWEAFWLHQEGYGADVPLEEDFLQLSEGDRLHAHPEHQAGHRR